MKIAFHLTIKGRVQGVGYRYYTQREAHNLGLTGYVKNLYNGDVEVFVEGEKETVEYFISYLRRGPDFADVDEIKVTKHHYEDKYEKFDLKVDSLTGRETGIPVML